LKGIRTNALFGEQGRAPGTTKMGATPTSPLGRKRTGRFGVRNGNKQTFVHGDRRWQPSIPFSVVRR
jgi:hypothetical protein